MTAADNRRDPLQGAPQSRFGSFYEVALYSLYWTLPVVIVMFGTKLVKLWIFRPMLASGVQAGDDVHLGWSRAFDFFVSPYTSRIIAALLALELVRYLFLRRLSRWWILLAAAVLYAAARAALILYHGYFTYPEVRIVRGVIAELRVTYTIFRQDLVTTLALCTVAVLIGALLSRASRKARSQVLGVAATILAAAFGLDLAYFLTTGMNATGQVAAFTFHNGMSTWFLIRSEINTITVACILLPVLTVMVWPKVARLDTWFAANRKSSLIATGAAFALTAIAIPLPSAQATPAFARFSSNPLAQIAHDMTRGFRSTDMGIRVEIAALQRPLLFDSDLAVVASSKPTRNVVIVMLESIRASATQLHDPQLKNMPFLADLATNGAMIENMYAVEPRTSAAWISILQGIYPGDGDMFFYWGSLEARRPRAASLPELLRRFDYKSAFFLPTHLRLQNDQQLVDNMGFDLVSTDSAVPSTSGFERVNPLGYEDKALLRPIDGWLAERAKDGTPFLLAVMTNVGHYPYKVPDTWPKADFQGQRPGEYSDYLNSIAYIDSYLKELVELFRRRNLADSTIFIILGDHGEAFGENGPRQHFGQAYEEVLHIPAVIYAPGLMQAGTRISGLRQQVDITPTILSMLGMNVVSGHLPGASLLAPAESDRKLFFSGVYQDTTLGMRTGSKKFLYNFERTPMEVYDIERNPKETLDLAGSISPSVLEDAKLDMLIWRASVNRALTHGHQP